ncbi:AAA family ATPase [Dyella sp. 20L07]|uniref:AAA family ATPase n=1 Tax=Dyella sp. 20L07 TaxID=3384240 RepID=UPI003D2C3986
MVARKAVNEAGQAENLLRLLLARISASTKRMHEGKVTYLIGNNGTGKSRMLGELADRLGETKPARTVACIASSIHDRFRFTDSRRVRYLGARNAPNAVFLAAVDRQMIRFILQAMQNDRRLLSQLCQAVKMDFSFLVGDGVEKQVADWFRQRDEQGSIRGKSKTHRVLLQQRYLGMLGRIRGTGRFEALTYAQIDTLLRYLDLNIDITLNIRLADDDVLNFRDLSTGEQNRALLFAKVLSAMEESTVFLIDEPEISLHLHWQMDFHRTLMDLLSNLKRFHVVIATHAPILISEAAKSDPDTGRNVVAVLQRQLAKGEVAGDHRPGSTPVTYACHTFSEVASHEHLVLRYFHTAPYHAHEVSAQIADAVLRVAEDGKSREGATKLLLEIREAVGVSDEAKVQIDSALELIRDRLVPSIQRVLRPSARERA